MITVAVGTFMFGFDELLQAADEAVAQLDLVGFAQSGRSRYVPHKLEFEPFLLHDALMARLRASRLLICHAGMGLIGDGLRAGCRIIVYPRQGETRGDHPANDQTAFARAIATRLGLGLCLTPAGLACEIERVLEAPDGPRAITPSNIPGLIRAHLDATRQP